MKLSKYVITTLVLAILAVACGGSFALGRLTASSAIAIPWTAPASPKPKPYLEYTIPALQTKQLTTSPITLSDELPSSTPEVVAYRFSYTTLGKTMSGRMTVPKKTSSVLPVPSIVMLRGYVSPEDYQPGVGTQRAAEAFSKAGFITFAPDFFGYGTSDPEPDDSWIARFEKPIVVAELLQSLDAAPTLKLPDERIITRGKIGLWGHSNGGQIALTTLEMLQRPIATSLWAPVTAPFPYSILFFSDELPDEGKANRLWIAAFEKDYDVFDFSLTQHLDALHGSLQLHHGTEDDAAPYSWSQEFVAKLKAENKRRQATETASDSAKVEPITINFFGYPAANHNLQPGWQTVVDRDISFFTKELTP